MELMREDFKYKIAKTIIHFRIYIILGFSFLTFWFLSLVKDIKFETTLGDFLPQKHPFIKVHNKLTCVFGGLNQVSIALKVKRGDIFNKDFLEKVINITQDLYLTDGVNISRIRSLASRNTKYVRVTSEGFFSERLLRVLPSTQKELSEFKKKVLSNPNILKMVSKDLKSTLIQVDFNPDVKTSYVFKVLQDLKKKYEDENTKIYIAGFPVLEGWMNFYLPKMVRLLFVSMGVIAVILYLTFRSKRGVILPFLDSCMATIWGIGVMKVLGLKLNPSTILVPFIVLSLGISHSVHTLKRYYEEMKDPQTKSKRAVINTVSSLLLPGLGCVLTDGFGFLSLLLVPIPAIRSMALASGVGIIANFFTSFMFTPSILSFLHRPKILEIKKEETHIWVDKFLKKLSIFSMNKRASRFLTICCISLILISLTQITKITVGDNSEGTSLLSPNTPYNISEKFINTHFGGTNSYYILISSKDQILSSKNLKEIDALQNYLLKRVRSAGSADSVANVIKALNMIIFGGNKKHFSIPEDDKTIAEYWFLYTISGFPGDFDHLITRDKKIANIKIDLKDHKTSTVNKIVKETENWLKTYKKSKDLNFEYAGGDIGILYAINDIIKKTLLPNFLFILFLIFLYVSLIYRSLVAGTFLIIPLIFSSLIVFCVFGFLNMSLTTETLPLVSLSCGLGINYGIYIIDRLYQEIRNKKTTYKNILYETLITSGKAVFFSGFIVSIGVFMWVFSEILLQSKLGLNLCISLLLNMIISLVLLPYLAWQIKPAFLFKRIKKRIKRRC